MTPQDLIQWNGVVSFEPAFETYDLRWFVDQCALPFDRFTPCSWHVPCDLSPLTTLTELVVDGSHCSALTVPTSLVRLQTSNSRGFDVSGTENLTSLKFDWDTRGVQLKEEGLALDKLDGYTILPSRVFGAETDEFPLGGSPERTTNLTLASASLRRTPQRRGMSLTVRSFRNISFLPTRERRL